jgi:hypothetical protein
MGKQIMQGWESGKKLQTEEVPTKEGAENDGSDKRVMISERKNKWKENESREEELRSNNRKKVNVYLSSLMMKVPDHVHVLRIGYIF